MTTPQVSVIVPAKNSASTIRECVDSLLSQDYLNLEVIVSAGPTDDTTWTALADIHDPRLIRIENDVTVHTGTRDSNFKRCAGLAAATGEILALTDSDMRLPEWWVTAGIAELREGRNWVVASSMISETSGYVGDYIDQNMIGSRTPRMDESYVLTQRSWGTKHHKPPITAALFMERVVYEKVGGPDPTFTNSYEDYVWGRAIVDAGYPIYCTAKLAGHHTHRTDVTAMFRDYRRSGRGASDYMNKYPDCRLAQRRRTQMWTIPALAVVGLLAFCLWPAWVTLAGIAVTALVCGASLAKTQTAWSVTYPLFTLALGLTFWYGLASQTLNRAFGETLKSPTGTSRVVTADSGEPTP